MDASEKQRAAEIHASAIVIDGHNDLPWKLRKRYEADLGRFDMVARHDVGHTDIPRLREGGVSGQFWAASVPAEFMGRGAAKIALEQIDLIKQMVALYPDLEMAYTASDVRRSAKAGKVASLIGVEGGHAIENSLGVLRSFYELGARYLTLTHSDTIEWADAATDAPRHNGLSAFGEEVVREMNRLGMLVDISHVSAETMADVLRVSQAPVIASHSNAREVADHSRNVPDDIIGGVAESGGVIMVNFSSGFVTPEGAQAARDMFDVWRNLGSEHSDESARESALRQWQEANPVPRGTISDLVDHIDHIVRIAGADSAGLGSDFDGIEVVPEGLEDVSKFPAITEELVTRGYTEADIVKILGENLLRAMEGVEAAAQQLRGD
jgi:membrane dipeptidase